MERGARRPCIIRCMLANSDWVINFGTLILAAAAIVSAWISVVSLKSSKNVLEAATAQSKATVDLVRVARAELAASFLPLLASVPQHHLDSLLDRDIDRMVLVHDKLEDHLTVSVPIRNVGRGPALIKEARLVSIDGSSSDVEAAPSHFVLPTGETTVIMARKTGEDDEQDQLLIQLLNDDFRVVVRYSDVTGDQRMQTALYVSAPNPNRFIFQVEFNKCDENWDVTGAPVLATRLSDDAPTPSD